MTYLFAVIAGIFTFSSAYAQSGGVLEGLVSERINVKWSTGFQSIPSSLKIADIEKVRGFTSAFSVLRAIETDVRAQEIFSNIEADTGCKVLLEVEAVKSPIDVRQLNDLGFNTKWIIRGTHEGQPFQASQNIETHGELRDAVQLMSVGQSQYIDILQKFYGQVLSSSLPCDDYHEPKLIKSSGTYKTFSSDFNPKFTPTLTEKFMPKVYLGKLQTFKPEPVATSPLIEAEKLSGQAIPRPNITSEMIIEIFKKDRKVNFDLIHNRNTLTNDIHQGSEGSDVFQKLKRSKLFALAFADLFQIDRDQLDRSATIRLAQNESFLVKIYFQRYDEAMNNFGGSRGNEAICLDVFLKIKNETKFGLRWEDSSYSSFCAPGITINLVLIRDGTEVNSVVVKPYSAYLYGPGTGNTVVTATQIIEAMSRIKH